MLMIDSVPLATGQSGRKIVDLEDQLATEPKEHVRGVNCAAQVGKMSHRV